MRLPGKPGGLDREAILRLRHGQESQEEKL